MIPQDFIDELLSRTDIVEIIEARVTLKKSGQNYTGLCPFHQEKSPSFSVSQDKQFYYCFGCQASGTAIKFLMEHDRMDFVPAVEYLAQRAGLEVPNDRQTDPAVSGKRKSIYDLLGRCTAFYRDQLKQHASCKRAVDYLKGRGLTGEIARDFGLGYAPPGWDNLMKALATTNADRQLLIDAGMLIERPEEDKTHDRFRDRIIFPIRDQRGRTLAFGGRVLDADATPKYLNSPETPVFHKGRELYGLFEARQRTRSLERLLVVEGYMDVVALAQHGLDYSVATLGTATSTEQVERIFRLVPQVVFCFDGDAAGSRAAWKALINTLPAMQDGRSARFLFLPEGDDPDSLVRREGREKFEHGISTSVSLSDFFFASLSENLDLNLPEDRATLASKAAPLILNVPDGVFRQLLIQTLADKTGLEEQRLLEIKKLDREASVSPDAPEARPQWQLKMSRQLEHATSILLRKPELARSLTEDDLARLDGVAEWQMLLELLRYARQPGKVSPLLLLAHYQETPWFDDLRRLAEQDPHLAEEQFQEEFQASLGRIFRDNDLQREQQAIDELKRKPLSELTREERELLANFRRVPQ